jgi:hypothetical protein
MSVGYECGILLYVAFHLSVASTEAGSGRHLDTLERYSRSLIHSAIWAKEDRMEEWCVVEIWKSYRYAVISVAFGGSCGAT